MSANLVVHLEAHAVSDARRTAIVEQRGAHRAAITFGELHRRVQALSGGLRHRGLSPGDAVVIFVPMSIDLYVALLAVLHAGAVSVFVDAWSGRSRIDRAIELARPRVFIGSPKSFLLRWTSRRLAKVPVSLMAGRRFAKLARHELAGDAAPPVAVASDAPAVVTFTTGTTGEPRGALRSHGLLWAQHEALSEHLGLVHSDVDMPTLPIFVLNNLAAGVTSVIPDFDPRRPAEIDPARIMAQMEREGVTTASGSPAFFERLLKWCESRGRPLPLRAAFTGGAPVLPELARRMAGPLIRGTGHVVFGSTEVEPISGITASEFVAALSEPKEKRPEGICVGPPVPQLQLRVVDVVDGAITLGDRGLDAITRPAGAIGEILVSGAHVLPSYLNDPQANRDSCVFENGRMWRRTGDCGALDREGRLWLVGRLGLRVRTDRGAIWPIPVELAALGCPVVKHAALVGRSTTGSELATPILCVETHAAITNQERAEITEAVVPWGVHEIVDLRFIPRDPRHQTKTDMKALSRLLKLSSTRN